jgi:hypothetical protein
MSPKVDFRAITKSLPLALDLWGLRQLETGRVTDVVRSLVKPA